MRVNLTVTPSAEGGTYVTGDLDLTPNERLAFASYLVAGGAMSANTRLTPNELAAHVTVLVDAIAKRVAEKK